MKAVDALSVLGRKSMHTSGRLLYISEYNLCVVLSLFCANSNVKNVHIINITYDFKYLAFRGVYKKDIISVISNVVSQSPTLRDVTLETN